MYRISTLNQSNPPPLLSPATERRQSHPRDQQLTRSVYLILLVDDPTLRRMLPHHRSQTLSSNLKFVMALSDGPQKTAHLQLSQLKRSEESPRSFRRRQVISFKVSTTNQSSYHVSRDNPFAKVILTRFSRVTFNAAHNYLGLTTEVLRTEKAINEIACHPLPNSFYEGGGLHSLRQRFDDVAVQESDSESDYFSHEPSPSIFSSGKVNGSVSAISSRERLAESPIGHIHMRTFPLRAHQQVQAGDLLTSTGQGNDAHRSHSRTFTVLNTPRIATSKNISFIAHLPGDEFDLRDEVMSCIAKSIGLLQPPISGGESIEASPAFPAFDTSKSPSGMFTSPFGSLSLLDVGDDNVSSVTGSSSNATGYMSGLDNEVEILFFSAGSTLVKTGERNTGRCSH